MQEHSDELATSAIGLSESSFPLAIANMTVNDASPVPIYEQICRAVRTAISAGDLPPGTPLPTSRELADALKVGRNTVVTAYSRLAAEGYLLTNKRRGTRVAEDTLGIMPLRREDRAAEAMPAPEPQPAGALGQWAGASAIEISYRARDALEASEPDTAQMAPFALNTPDPSLYPRNPLSRLLAEEFCRSPGGGDLQFGMRKFQTAMAHYLRHMRGVDCEPAQIIPITGLESALDLTIRVMIDPGHTVYIEDPASDVVRHCLRSAGAQLVAVPSDSAGADISRVSGPPPRLIFVSPSANFPFGQQMSEPRRAAMLDAARNWNAAIFECDVLWELSYTGNRLRAMQGRDKSAPVFYFGSLNQTLGPHIRAGYLVVPAKLVDPFTSMAQRVSYGPEPFVLGALATFIEDTDYAVHARTIRGVYAERLKVLIEAVRQHIPDVTILEPSGGLHLSVLFNQKINERAVASAASERGLSVTPLSRFYLAGERRSAQSGIVLGFGTLPERMIDTMVKRLGEVIAEVREMKTESLVA